MPLLTALLLASLAMSTSPAALMGVINEARSSGQVTERVLHLTAVNCLLSVFTFKVIGGFWTFQTSGSVWQAISNSLVPLVWIWQSAVRWRTQAKRHEPFLVPKMEES